jgi:hypothetical protein
MKPGAFELWVMVSKVCWQIQLVPLQRRLHSSTCTAPTEEYSGQGRAARRQLCAVPAVCSHDGGEEREEEDGVGAGVVREVRPQRSGTR